MPGSSSTSRPTSQTATPSSPTTREATLEAPSRAKRSGPCQARDNGRWRDGRVAAKQGSSRTVRTPEDVRIGSTIPPDEGFDRRADPGDPLAGPDSPQAGT